MICISTTLLANQVCMSVCMYVRMYDPINSILTLIADFYKIKCKRNVNCDVNKLLLKCEK